MNELEMLHKLELKIAVEIKRVCEKHNLRYCLAYGSLLGAVRHGGFIPWDDDLDIAMPRDDYEKFIGIFSEETDKDVFFLENWDTEDTFGLSFSKVKLNGTVFEENSIKNTNTHKGVFVDVFPYDCLPDDNDIIGKTAKKLLRLGKLYKFRKNYLPTNPNNKPQLILSKLIGAVGKMIPEKVLRNKIYTEETRYNSSPDIKYTSVLSGAYNCRDLLPAEYLNEFVNIGFENETFCAPARYKEVLTCIYGDYMQLPPEEKRVFRHNALRIDFEKYTEA